MIARVDNKKEQILLKQVNHLNHSTQHLGMAMGTHGCGDMPPTPRPCPCLRRGSSFPVSRGGSDLRRYPWISIKKIKKIFLKKKEKSKENTLKLNKTSINIHNSYYYPTQHNTIQFKLKIKYIENLNLILTHILAINKTTFYAPSFHTNFTNDLY